MVIVDEPIDKYAGGSKVAAPVFQEIMLKSLRKLDIAPNYESIAVEETDTPTEVMISTPDITGMKGLLAKEKLKNAGLQFEFIGNGSIIEQQIPTAGSLVHPTQTVYLITEQKENLSVPDLTGVSLRDVVEIAALLGVQLKIEGTGYVYSQQLVEDGKSKILQVKLSPLKESEYYVPGTLEPSGEEDEAASSDEESDIDTEMETSSGEKASS